MQGRADTEPSGISAEVFYVLGMYDRADGITASTLRQAIKTENAPYGATIPTPAQVHGALTQTLARRKPPLVEQVPGRQPRRWRITPHGYRMLAAWCGDDEPVRIPCGLGWPP